MTGFLQNPLSVRQSAEEAAADLPALMALAERAVTSVLHGDHAQRKVGSGEKFWQFREYNSTDRPQDIDWRQSGKTDNIFIRQKEWQTPQATLFWCANSAGMDFSTKGRDARVLSLALAILMTRAGEQVGLFGQPGTGRSDLALQKIGNALCGPRAGVLDLPDTAAHGCPKNTHIVLAGDFLRAPDDIAAAFKPLAAQAGGGLVIQVLDNAEIELPFSGRVLFQHPGSGEKHIVNHVQSVRESYRERIKNHIRAVETISKECGWHYILHRTDKPVEDTLAAVWERMSFHSIAAPGVRA